MGEYTREFCSSCGDYSVHYNGACLHHDEICSECGRGLKRIEGRYRKAPDKAICIECYRESMCEQITMEVSA